MATVGFPALRQGEFCLLEVALPGKPPLPAGIVLFDREKDTLLVRMRDDWGEIAPEEDAEVLRLLEDDLNAKARAYGGEKLLAFLEDTLSNILRISSRREVSFRVASLELNRLFEQHVARVAPVASSPARPRVVKLNEASGQVRPYVTHIPVYSLRAAATKFGEDMEVNEEGWVEAPPGLRVTPDLFVARVVGRSMEPRIPDGSLCIFRANVTGSRQGRLVLVRRAGASATGGEFTIKRYKSVKRVREDGSWEHEKIRLEPLNPDFEAWELEPGEFQVLGEFVQIYDL